MSDTGNAARAVISGSHSTHKMRELQLEILHGEVRDHVEHAEPYGYTSEPETDKSSEAFVIFFGGDRSHGIVICAANRQFRPTDLKPGDVVIYDKRKHFIRFEEGKIRIITPDNLEAYVDGDVIADVKGNVTAAVTGNVALTVDGELTADVAGAATVTSAASITIKAPITTIDGQCTITGGLSVQGKGASGAAMKCKGNMELQGHIEATQDITAGGISLMSHTHSGVEAGPSNTGGPQ